MVGERLVGSSGWLGLYKYRSRKGTGRRPVPKFYAYYDRDWKTYNARLVEEYKKDDFAELVSSVSKSHQTLIDFLKTVPAEEFEKDKAVRLKGYKVTLARLLQAEIDDEKIHYDQIKQFFNVSLP